jgi:hypothetical protein
MTKRLAVCFIPLIPGFVTAISAQEKQALRLVQTIPLPGVTGRLDHMGVDLEKKRLFVAAVVNNTLEVVDLADAKVIKNLSGFNDTQDALFLGGDFNKLYVSSLDGYVRVFQRESFRLVQDFKVEPIRTVFSTTPRPTPSILAMADRMQDSMLTNAWASCSPRPEPDTTNSSPT